MKYKYILLSIAISTATPLFAQDTKVDSVELEKAVFLQDTKKDYAAAAKIYQEVLANSKRANLETTYRLSQCQKELGQQNEYKHSLNALSESEDKTNKWVKLAIEENKLALEFEKPVWEDGDALTYNAILPNDSKGNSHTILYEKGSSPSIWNVSVLRNYYHFSRENTLFDASNYRPLSSRGAFIHGDGRNAVYDTEEEWDHKSFEDGQFFTLVRVLPFDTVKRHFDLTVFPGRKWPVILYRTEDKRTITTAAGEFECSKVICKVDVERGITIEMWVNTKGKREIIELTQPGRKIQLTASGKRKDVESKITKAKAFPLMYHSKSGLHQVSVNNDEVYRSMLYPSEGIYLARLEINHTKNLLESLREDPVAFATHIENNIRKKKKNPKFKLPKNAERLTIAGCEGVIYTDATRVKNAKSGNQFICFFGVNENYSIALQGVCSIGQEKAAREELKRILTKDLKEIE